MRFVGFVIVGYRGWRRQIGLGYNMGIDMGKTEMNKTDHKDHNMALVGSLDYK